MGHAVRNEQNLPSNLRELHQSLMDEWQRFGPERLNRLVESMPQCIDNVVRNREGPTGYLLVKKGKHSILHRYVRFGQSETNVSYHIL